MYAAVLACAEMPSGPHADPVSLDFSRCRLTSGPELPRRGTHWSRAARPAIRKREQTACRRGSIFEGAKRHGASDALQNDVQPFLGARRGFSIEGLPTRSVFARGAL
jgi:hypothetical protein